MKANKPKRQTLAALLVLCMVFSMLPFSAFAAYNSGEKTTQATIVNQVADSTAPEAITIKYNYTYDVESDVTYKLTTDVTINLVGETGFTPVKAPQVKVTVDKNLPIASYLQEYDSETNSFPVKIVLDGTVKNIDPAGTKLTITGTLFEKAKEEEPAKKTAMTDTLAGISGTAKIGSTLTAQISNKAVAATDGYTFQWESSSTKTGTYTAINGATAATYELKDEALVGKYVRVTVTATDANATYTGKASSAGVQVLAADVVTTPVTAVAISGTPKDGQTLTASVTPAGATVKYQWQYSEDKNSWYDIEGATKSTYAPTADRAGKYIRVVVTGTGTYTGTVNAEAVGPVAATIASAVVTTPGSSVAVDNENSVFEGTSLRLSLKGSLTANAQPYSFTISFADSNGISYGGTARVTVTAAAVGQPATVDPTTVTVNFDGTPYTFAVDVSRITVIDFEWGEATKEDALPEDFKIPTVDASEFDDPAEAADAQEKVEEIVKLLQENPVESTIKQDTNVAAEATKKVTAFKESAALKEAMAKAGVKEDQVTVVVKPVLDIKPQAPKKDAKTGKTQFPFEIKPTFKMTATANGQVLATDSKPMADEGQNAVMDQEVRVDIPLGDDFLPDGVSDEAVVARHFVGEKGELIKAAYSSGIMHFWTKIF